MRTFTLIFILLFFLTGCFNNNEPTVFSIAINPSNSDIVYVATMNGVFKSHDSGKSWESRSEGLGDAHVLSLAMDPASPSTIYAGTFGDAIYKSQDGGQHWFPANIGMKGHVSVVNAFAFYPRDPKVIFAATTIGVFKSLNEGGEWEEKVSGMESVYTVSLIFDPKNSNTLYAGTSGGIYRSDDLAEHWKIKNVGLIEHEVGSAMALGINSILINPRQNNLLSLGTDLGIFQSMDGADHWNKTKNGLGSSFVIALVLDAKDTQTIYAGTDTGIYKTVDGGQTWMAKNEGLKNRVIRSLVFDQNRSQTLYAGTQNGLYKSVDGGEQWILLKGYIRNSS